MRLVLATAVAIALLTSSVQGGQRVGPSATQAAPATAAISGVVTDGATGRPLAGASVYVLPVVNGRTMPTQRAYVLTDARGRFVFADLPAGAEYNVSSSRAGYDVGRYEGAVSPGSAPTRQNVSIPLADGEWMRDANIRMWRFGSIAGRIVDERAEPVVGAAVRLFSRRLVAGHPLLVPGPVATTDDRGAYRIPYLAPGQYVVGVLSVQATVPATMADGARRLPIGGLEGRGASSPGASRPEAAGASIDVDGRHRLMLSNFATPPPPGADRPRTYAPQFYPNARTPDDAQWIDLELGASRTAVDFQLTPVSAVPVTGRVTGPVQDATNMVLRLMPRGAEHLGFGSEVATSVIEGDGTFTFLNVPAGDYTLIASPAVAELGTSGSQGSLPRGAGYGSARGLSTIGAMWWRFDAGAGVWGRLPVGVGEADITGLSLALQPASTVRGRVVFDDPAPPDPAQRFTITLEPANGDSSLGAPFTSTAAGDSSHGFVLAGLQGGRYVIRFQSFGGWLIKSVTDNNVDVTSTGFDAARAQDYNDVVVTVAKANVEISGFVRDRGGQPMTAAVLMFPADDKLWTDYGLTPDRMQSVVTNTDGAFKMLTVNEGDFFVIAVRPELANAWTDPKFLGAAAGQAARVPLKKGAVTIQSLPLSEVVVR